MELEASARVWFHPDPSIGKSALVLIGAAAGRLMLRRLWLSAVAGLLAGELLPRSVRRLLIGAAGRRGRLVLVLLGLGFFCERRQGQHRAGRERAGENH